MFISRFSGKLREIVFWQVYEDDFSARYQCSIIGRDSFVFAEEVLGTDTAMWFSPTGEHLAFATMNDTEVVEAVIVKYGKPGDLKNQYTYEEKFRYPKVRTRCKMNMLIIEFFAEKKRPVGEMRPVYG